MRITNCVPLAGQGVIARYGGLVAVTDGSGPGPDPLLSAVAETADEAGDGSALVIRAARAALRSHRHAAWACAGVTADGGLAVLVHGNAAATIRVDGGPEVTLTVGDSMLPVSRTFDGPTVTAILVIGGAAPPDERFWLGDGVVYGGGLAVTASAERPASHAPVPRASVPRAPAPVIRQGPDVRPPAARPTALDVAALDVAAVGVANDAHPPTVDTPAAGTPAGSPRASEAEAASEDAVMVDGVLCANGHFNDPGASSCRQCGIAMEQPPRRFDRRPRPPLGELVLDDGARVPLDRDYVLGREPTLDGDVLAGRARPLRINDPNGTVSRLHLKVSLVGWQVEVSDLGSANGSVLQAPGEERTLTPFEPTAIEPGARIGIGHRSMQYVAYQGARP
jgi:hypothetical protein